MFVPVVDRNQKPLMPTTPARARRWLKCGKATAFWSGGIFCVRLNAEPSARVTQPVVVGIDPGSKREGYSVISSAHTYLNLQAEARTNVQEAEQQSTRMRPGRGGRWNRTFSPLQAGKASFYSALHRLAPVTIRQGWETQAHREQLGLKKTNRKLADVWHAHCVDAWVLAHSLVGGSMTPDNTRLVCIVPLLWHRRQLHRLQPERGGKRKSYGGTLSQGIKRGTLIQHPKWGKAYVGGTLDGRLSLHDPITGKRITQTAKVIDCRIIKLLRWRTRLVPVSAPSPRKERSLPPSA